jgi:hypothetical protein
MKVQLRLRQFRNTGRKFVIRHAKSLAGHSLKYGTTGDIAE